MLSSKQGSIYVGLVLLVVGGAVARAQELAIPPIRQLVDKNGVDLMSGQFSVSQSDIGIGPPESSLSYTRSLASYRIGSYHPRASTDALLKFVAGTPSFATVSVGGAIENFNGTSTFVAQNGMGSTLVFDTSSQNYIYTKRDGTVIRFPAKTGNETADGLRAISILRPDGTLTEFSTKKWPDAISPSRWHVRVQSVVNNAGYQLKLEYGGAQSKFPAKVYVLNRAAAYCDPVADTCAATSGAPSRLSIGRRRPTTLYTEPSRY